MSIKEDTRLVDAIAGGQCIQEAVKYVREAIYESDRVGDERTSGILKGVILKLNDALDILDNEVYA